MSSISTSRPDRLSLPITATQRPRPWRIVTMIAVCLYGVFLVWFSLGDHPLYVPDEGRYARTTQVMVEFGDLIVPRVDGEARLQKPPLVHWLQGAAMLVIGPDEWAVRLPGAIAGSLIVLLIVLAGWNWRDLATGLIAAALTLMCPLFLVVHRLAIIDPILHLFWLAAILFGYGATRRPNARCMINASPAVCAGLFWLALAAATFAKGPIGLIPALVVFLWVILNRHAGAMRWWHWPVGLLVALAPLAAWVVAVIVTQPDAWAVWRAEIVDRVSGAGDHAQPLWYYIPVFLGGLFPASAMLPVIGWQISLHRLRAAFRAGHALAYLLLATVVPLIVVSLIAGKLATYLLPLAAPVALIAAWHLRSWLDIPDDHRRIAAERPRHRARRLPDSMNTVAVVAVVGWVGGAIFVTSTQLLRREGFTAGTISEFEQAVLPLVIVPVLMVVAALMWRRASMRGRALLLAAVAWFAATNWAMEFGEDTLTKPYANAVLLDRIHQTLPDQTLHLSTFGYHDQSLGFYADRDVLRIAHPERIAENPTSPGERWVILAEAADWRHLESTAPDFVARFDPLFEFPRARDTILVLAERDRPVSD